VFELINVDEGGSSRACAVRVYNVTG